MKKNQKTPEPAEEAPKYKAIDERAAELAQRHQAVCMQIDSLTVQKLQIEGAMAVLEEYKGAMVS